MLTISRGDGFRSGPVLRRLPVVVPSLVPGAAVAVPVAAIVVAFPLGDVGVEVVGSAEAVTLLVALRGGKLATLVGLHLQPVRRRGLAIGLSAGLPGERLLLGGLRLVGAHRPLFLGRTAPHVRSLGAGPFTFALGALPHDDRHQGQHNQNHDDGNDNHNGRMTNDILLFPPLTHGPGATPTTREGDLGP